MAADSEELFLRGFLAPLTQIPFWNGLARTNSGFQNVPDATEVPVFRKLSTITKVSSDYDLD